MEGKTEIQLLNNKHIVELYPELKQVTIVRYDSDDSSLKLVYPDFMIFSIPYFTMVDMDKIISYSYTRQKFKVKSGFLVNPLFNPLTLKKQQFIFYNDDLKRKRTYDARLQLERRLDEEKFLQDKAHLYIADTAFDTLVKEIKQYCCEYRVIPVSTTVEGVIASDCNVETVIKWMRENLDDSGKKELKELLMREPRENRKYRATIIRCILNGKLDNLCGMGENGVKVGKEVKTKVKKLNLSFGKKVGGWIGLFMDYYFRHKIEPKKDIAKKKKEFEKDFPESG